MVSVAPSFAKERLPNWTVLFAGVVKVVGVGLSGLPAPSRPAVIAVKPPLMVTLLLNAMFSSEEVPFPSALIANTVALAAVGAPPIVIAFTFAPVVAPIGPDVAVLTPL